MKSQLVTLVMALCIGLGTLVCISPGISVAQADSLPQTVPTPTPTPTPPNPDQLFRQATESFRRGDYDQALLSFQEALTGYREAGDSQGEALTLQVIGVVYRAMGDYTRALDFFNRALSILAIDDRANAASTLNNIGAVYVSLEQYREALEYYQQALVIWQEIDDRTGEGTTLNNIGAIYYNLGQYVKAVDYLQQALAIRQEIGDPAGEETTLANTGMAYYSLGQYDQALDYFEQALTIAQEIDDQVGEGRVLTNIGVVYYHLGRYVEALDYLQRSLDIQRGIGDRAGEAAALKGLGTVYQALSDYEQAIAYYQQALTIQREIGDRAGEAAALKGLGTVYQALSDYEQALAYYQQALTIQQEIGDRAGEAATLGNLTNIYEAQGQQEQALEHALQAVAVMESIHGELKVEALQTAFTVGTVDYYHRIVHLLLAQGREAEAFHYAERGRARTFLTLLGNQRVVPTGSEDPDLIQQEAQLRGELTALEGQLQEEWSKPADQRSQQVIDYVTANLGARRQEYEELLTQLQLTNPEYAGLVSISPLTLEEAQALLRDQAPDVTLVSYFVGEEEMIIFVIGPETFRAKAIPVTRQELRQEVEVLLNLMGAEPLLPDAWQQPAQALYEWLTAPVQEHLPSTDLDSPPPLGIVPCDLLHYLPFGLLYDGEHTLLDGYTLFYAPSVSSLRFIFERRHPQADTLLAFANPDAPGAPHLRYAVEEAQAVAALYRTQPLIGAEATEGRFKAQAGRYGLVHIAAHSDYDPHSPLFSAILLQPDGEEDGRLEAHEVLNLDLPQTDMLVLSGSQTHLGELSRGDELVGLERAFLRAGFPSVLTTLWSVDDAATAALMERFYTHLRAGVPKAEALRLAQIEMQAEYHHPYYWAGFILVGDFEGYRPTISFPTWSQLARTLGIVLLPGSISLAFLLLFSYLYFFIARPNQISIPTALQFLFYPRQLALAAGGGYLEHNWENWQHRIWSEIVENGRVADSALSGVPTPFRGYALQRYYREHSGLDLAYDENRQIVKHRQEALLQSLNHMWEEARQAIERGDEVATPISRLAEQFSALVSLPISAPKKNTVGALQYYVMDTTIAFQNTKLLETLPLIVLGRLELNEIDLDSIREIFKRFKDTSRRIALLILFLDADRMDRARQRIDEKLRQAYACDVIALGREEILQTVFQKDRHRALRKVVLQNVVLTTMSPFTTIGPVPVHAFFGRESELREIAEHAGTDTYVVIGGRRVGKTSLLKCLHHVRLPTAGFRTLYCDCSTTPTYEALLAAAIHNWQPEAPPDIPTTFGDLLQSSPADKPLILLLDEADKLVPTDRADGWRLFNALRVLSNVGRVQVVLSGERTLREALRDPKSPLFNFANEILLGPLEYRAVEELITRPMKQLEIGLADEAAIVQRIWEFTSGHPNVVQRLCHCLIERLNEQGTRRITLDDVDAVINDPGFQEEDFLGTYWERATPLERIISLLMAQEAKPYRLQAILNVLDGQGLQPEPEVVKAALDRLVDLRSILKRSQVGYEFAVTAFPLVLANTTTAEDLLIVLRSQYLKNPMELIE